MLGTIIFLFAYLVIRSIYSVPQISTPVAPLPTVNPTPEIVVATPSPSPKITEIDTRNPKQVDAFNDYFTEYCKTNDCSTPKPTPTQTPKPTPNNLSFCYVEKDGSFYMTGEECMKLNNADPTAFRRKAYENCKDGKNPEVKTTGDQRKADCTKLFGLNY